MPCAEKSAVCKMAADLNFLLECVMADFSTHYACVRAPPTPRAFDSLFKVRVLSFLATARRAPVISDGHLI